MDDKLIQDFLMQFDDARFPAGFLTDYEAMECLAYREGTETLLVKHRKTGGLCVAKCYSDKSLLSRHNEAELLKKLSHPGLPAYIGEYENDGMLCVLREYAEGEPLDCYAARRSIREDEAVFILVRLCDILAYLHAQTPPVIHRDIKSQNIIIAPGGQVRLIDFGISRVYDETAETDTVCFGTRRFAAPEQYGFSQTDARADIFSAGVLLGFLLTGETESSTSRSRIKNPRLRKIVEKCTAFAPRQRYSSAAALKSALLRADGRRQTYTIRAAGIAAACFLCLCAGFYLGRYTRATPAFLRTPGVHFSEPLVEQAVRLMLDKADGEPIEEDDLLNITEIWICGDKAAKSGEEYAALSQSWANKDGTVHNGGMRTLEDIIKLKNLISVQISVQEIEDLSPLAGLSHMEYLDIRHTPASDLSPLQNARALTELCVFGTQADTYAPLTACPRLQRIDAGGTPVSSISEFADIKNLTQLSLGKTTLPTLAGIERLTNLQSIRLDTVTDGDLTPLMKPPALREAQLPETLRTQAEQQLAGATFQITYYS